MIPRKEVPALKQQKRSLLRQRALASVRRRMRRHRRGSDGLKMVQHRIRRHLVLRHHAQHRAVRVPIKPQVQDRRSQAAVPAQDSILHAGQLPITHVLLSSVRAHRSKAANVHRSRVLGVQRRRAGASRSADCAGAESLRFCWCLSPVWPWPLR